MSEIFSRPIRAGQIKDAARDYDIQADQGQCAALAKLFGLPRIKLLRGKFSLLHEQGGAIAAALHLTAQVSQICVVTLEPFEAAIEERVKLRFVPAAKVAEGSELAALDAEALEGPDEIPYAGETIDLGAALAEQLALSLEPYPRKPGAALPEVTQDAAAHPFAALAARKAGGANRQ